ncbi:hypothetical protein ACMGDH_04325 [Sphingomonas sp. DT-207]
MLATVSAGLFFFRDQCEPVLRWLLPLIAGRHSHFRYDPDSYYFWAGLAGVLALLWISLFSMAALRKPADDRRIDAALRARQHRSARGAPLEPD